MSTRRDRLTELLVDVAINIATARGIAAGAVDLADLGVPLEVAEPVLLRHGRRRRRVPAATEETHAQPHWPAAPG